MLSLDSTGKAANRKGEGVTNTYLFIKGTRHCQEQHSSPLKTSPALQTSGVDSIKTVLYQTKVIKDVIKLHYGKCRCLCFFWSIKQHKLYECILGTLGFLMRSRRKIKTPHLTTLKLSEKTLHYLQLQLPAFIWTETGIYDYFLAFPH